MQPPFFRLGQTLAILLFFIALVPTLVTSGAILYRRHHAIAQEGQAAFEHTVTRLSQDVRVYSAQIGPQLNQLSYNRSLSEAVTLFTQAKQTIEIPSTDAQGNPVADPVILRQRQRNAELSLSIFLGANRLIKTAYLIDTTGEVVEHINGRINHLESSPLVEQVLAWGESYNAQKGKHLILTSEDTALGGNLSNMEYGSLVVAVPVYRHTQRASAIQTPVGFVLAVIPWHSIITQLESYLQPDEYLSLRLAGEKIFESRHSFSHPLTEGATYQRTLNLSISWPQAATALAPIVTIYSYKENTPSNLGEAQRFLLWLLGMNFILIALSSVLFTRWFTAPLRQLAVLVRGYAMARYHQPSPDLRFVEYDEVGQLLQEMGQTITAQMKAQHEQNEELQQVNREKETFNQQLLGFNDRLAEEVATQTSVLRSTLAREERTRHVLQSWLLSGLCQKIDSNIEELVRSAMQSLSQLYPTHGWGLIARRDGLPPYAQIQGVNEEAIAPLHAKLLQLMDKEGKDQLEYHWNNEFWMQLSLTSSQNGASLGYLMVTVEDLESEDQAILRLFVKQMAMEIEASLFTDELARVARTDTLTGLPNRQAFDEAFTHYQAVLTRNPQLHVGLFMLDLNGLKFANDHYGHEAGDALLSAMAELLRQQCRQNEMIFRMGGDEFMLLVEADVAGCQHLAERLVSAQQNATVVHGAHSFPLRFAQGWRSSDTTPLADLSREADRAMYADKARFYQANEASITPRQEGGFGGTQA
ncbi:MAG: diguanylate cyclase domain-containing protein [Aeromonas sp.]